MSKKSRKLVRDAAGEDELQLRVVPDRLAELAFQQVGDVDLAALQHREAGGRFRHALEHEAFDRRHLAPVVLVRLHHQFDARLHG